MIIDPPSPFAPLSEWKEYLDELRDLDGDDQVRAAIVEAEAVIAEKTAQAS